MARKKKNDSRKPRECKFLGDSKELKKYLVNKKASFEKLLKEQNKELSDKQKEKIIGYIDAIEEMLDQKYFRSRKLFSMEELIEEIKIERDDLSKEIDAIRLEKEKAKQLADKAFEAEKGYYANKFEPLYDTPGQIELRNLVGEYQVLVFQIESLEKCKKALWWLLGVIHRPIGFFEKVIDEQLKIA